MNTRASARTAGPSYANELITEEPVRKIHDELYGQTGYDAIWRLSNAGFVIRLGDTVIFVDPVFTSPLASYEAARRTIAETGGTETVGPEFRYYDRYENIKREVHALPLSPEEVERADYVLITHDHGDHIDPPGLAKIAHHTPTVLAPESCLPRDGRFVPIHNGSLLEVGLPDSSIVEARHGDRHEYQDFSVTVIPAKHLDSVGACGYLIETSHGSIYHPGDGQYDHADKDTVLGLEVDYLFIPINDTNLGVGYAATLTYILQPRVVIPCHYGYTYPPVRSQGGHPDEFVTALAARNYKLPFTDIAILSPGGRLVLA